MRNKGLIMVKKDEMRILPVYKNRVMIDTSYIMSRSGFECLKKMGSVTNPDSYPYEFRTFIELHRFRVVFLAKGTHNPNFPECKIDRDTVEFYDRNYDFTPDGQFVSRYYAETLLEDSEASKGKGLVLDTGTPAWTVGAREMDMIRAWLAEVSKAVND